MLSAKIVLNQATVFPTRATDRSMRRNRILHRLKFVSGQFNLRQGGGLRLVAKLDQIKMPAFDPNRPAVFLDNTLNGAYSQSKLDDITLAELDFRHDLFCP